METLPIDNYTGKNTEGAFANLPLKYLTASSIIGDSVHDEKDEPMGKIEDIMINISTSQIEYYVVEFGGFLGIGIKYYAIPAALLKVDPEKKVFIFKADKVLLETAPGFDLNHWPETNLHEEESHWSFI